MAKDLLINVSEGEECRIALLEDGRLQELYMERTSSTSHVGNIYKGRVTNVEASIQAAFVDFGLGRNGFLHISDLMPTYFGRQGEDIQETVGRKMARRDRPPIQRCLRRGDEIVVQIIKEGIGTKGPTLTTYLSVPGKILVMMPGVGKSGVSRKIEDEVERRRLRQILDQLEPPEDAGFIIRTAGVGATKAEIQRDLSYLARLWATFKKKRDSGPGPMELYTEGDLITRTVRDVFTTDVDRLVIDNKEVVRRVKEVIKLANPRTPNKVELYEDPIPMFDKFGVEREIELMYSRHVPLPSGGSLVIDSTEAIVAIDVNSGKSRDFSDAETTAFKTDMEAADEICRQLKLRDLGGVIICDFIDLRYERHRRELWNRLDHNLKIDRAKTKVLPMSQFGIIEMTRQRMRPSLKRSVYFDCPHCKGAGLVKTPESMSLDVMRRVRIAINDQRVARVELVVCNDVAFYLQNKKRQQLGELEAHYGKRIVIRGDGALGLDEMRVSLFDNREGTVIVDGLGMVSQPPHTTQLGTRPHQTQQQRGRGGRGGGGRNDDDRQRNDQRRGQQRSHRDEEMAEDRFDRVEEEVEDREEGEPFSAPREDEFVNRGPVVVEESSHEDGVPAHEDDEPVLEGAQTTLDDATDDDSSHDESARDESIHDDSEDDDAEPVEARRDRDERPPINHPRDQRQRDDRPRNDRQRDNGPRDNGPRDNGPRDQRPRDERDRDNRGGFRPDQRGTAGRHDPRQQGGHRDNRQTNDNRQSGRFPRDRIDNRQGDNRQGENRQNDNRQGDNRQGGGRNDNRQFERIDNRQGGQGGRGGQGSQGGPRDTGRSDNRQGSRPDQNQPHRPVVREAGIPGGGPNTGDQNGDNQQHEGDGKRRRRRRGRRGRGRNREFQEGQQPQGQPAIGDNRQGPPAIGGESTDEAVRQLDDIFAEEDAAHALADREREPENVESDHYEREDLSGESEGQDRARESESNSDREADSEHDRDADRDREHARTDQSEPIAAPNSPSTAEQATPERAEKPKRRRAATAKPAPKPKPNATKGKAAKPKAAKPASAAKGRTRKPAPKPKTRTAKKATDEPGGAVAAAPTIVRTGSTDRHLMEDEPVLPQPARRPRSVRDLDSIPDDFDE